MLISRSLRRFIALAGCSILLVAVGTLLKRDGFATGLAKHDNALKWTESAWNMPLDNWGQGRVWRATAPGGDILLFARTKTGFCNCFNGIADDAEIDRIGDVDLHGDNFIATAPGETVSVGDLPGRGRSFQASNRWNGARHVLSIVAATDCKAVVATIVSDQVIPADAEASAVALLTGDSFRRWAADR